MRRILARGVLLVLLAAPVSALSQTTEPPPALPDLEQPVVEPEAGADAAPADGAIPNRTIETGADAPRMAEAPLLTVDQERLFLESAWGRRAQSALEEKGRKIAEENETLAEQLSAEEAKLTEQRATLDPAEFRKLAEAFDSRATTIRRERAQAVQDLNTAADADRTAFYQAALPIMGEMMQERGAVAVLDLRTVFVSLDAIDITSDLVRRLDDRLGDGTTGGGGN
ncbi:OmpH family outer membrane protein [Paracoccus marinaquae]|uniref:OmpH family outer membrane protein n=1 Tax=Paracoccus marinaquae TaxID=2841926 RepID=A0ABS6ALB9_9RHOB|nr:OmpH family outer membrane protein [Paracoccus marinaquae]MBU3031001.1 OmpH family outer membrane protein [Paracoccus marinaquae]